MCRWFNGVLGFPYDVTEEYIKASEVEKTEEDTEELDA